MLDLSLFRNQTFSGATASAMINYVGLLPTAQPLIMAVTAPISSTISDRIGPRESASGTSGASFEAKSAALRIAAAALLLGFLTTAVEFRRHGGNRPA